MLTGDVQGSFLDDETSFSSGGRKPFLSRSVEDVSRVLAMSMVHPPVDIPNTSHSDNLDLTKLPVALDIKKNLFQYRSNSLPKINLTDNESPHSSKSAPVATVLPLCAEKDNQLDILPR